VEQSPQTREANDRGGSGRPQSRRYALKDLLSGITPDEMREAFDWGPELGREVVAK